jgi:hypothetical protein
LVLAPPCWREASRPESRERGVKGVSGAISPNWVECGRTATYEEAAWYKDWIAEPK